MVHICCVKLSQMECHPSENDFYPSTIMAELTSANVCLRSKV